MATNKERLITNNDKIKRIQKIVKNKILTVVATDAAALMQGSFYDVLTDSLIDQIMTGAYTVV